MSVLLMRLAGPMQSWGIQSRFSNRDTMLDPSRSGVIGLLCAALGWPRDHSLNDFFPLTMMVRVDREGRLMRDYHTVQTLSRANALGKVDTLLTERFYLSDADFLVGLEGERTFLEQLQSALENPVWTLFLGRKSFIPTVPVGQGVCEGELFTTVCQWPWQLRGQRDRVPKSGLRLIVEVPMNTPDAERRLDVPLSFASQDRHFGLRYVKQLNSRTPICVEDVVNVSQ